ncbi:hypothetical protein Tco_0452729 [Tanacetum coccineum]
MSSGHSLEECPKAAPKPVVNGMDKVQLAKGPSVSPNATIHANTNVASTSGYNKGIPITTPLVARITKLESQMLDAKLVLVGDDEKPLNFDDRKIILLDLQESDEDAEVENVYDKTSTFIASKLYLVWFVYQAYVLEVNVSVKRKTNKYALEEDTGNSMYDLVDDTKKKVEAPPRKLGFGWVGKRKAFSLETNFFDRDVFEFVNMDQGVEEAENGNVPNEHDGLVQYQMEDTLQTGFVMVSFSGPGDELMNAGKEVDIRLDGGHDKKLRPADMLLCSWDGGLDVCVDLTGSFPYTQQGSMILILGGAVMMPCKRKREEDAVTLLKRIWKFSMTQDIGTRVALHIFNRIGVAIAKGVGVQIVSWLPLTFYAVTLLKRIRKFSITQDIRARAAIHNFNRISFAIAKGVMTQIVSRLPSNFLDKHAVVDKGRQIKSQSTQETARYAGHRCGGSDKASQIAQSNRDCDSRERNIGWGVATVPQVSTDESVLPKYGDTVVKAGTKVRLRG